MRPRLTYLAVLSVSLVALVLTDGCSRQGEGERCDQTANGNADCDDGLTCIPYSRLQGGADKTDRCCSTPSANAHCVLGTPNGVDTGGSSGTGGTGGNDAGPDSGGQAGAP